VLTAKAKKKKGKEKNKRKLKGITAIETGMWPVLGIVVGIGGGAMTMMCCKFISLILK